MGWLGVENTIGVGARSHDDDLRLSRQLFIHRAMHRNENDNSVFSNTLSQI